MTLHQSHTKMYLIQFTRLHLVDFTRKGMSSKTQDNPDTDCESDLLSEPSFDEPEAIVDICEEDQAFFRWADTCVCGPGFTMDTCQCAAYVPDASISL
jgi:hypothetical protein